MAVAVAVAVAVAGTAAGATAAVAVRTGSVGSSALCALWTARALWIGASFGSIRSVAPAALLTGSLSSLYEVLSDWAREGGSEAGGQRRA